MMATASSVRLLIRYTGMQACMILLELNVAIIWSCLANDSNSSLRIIITLDFSHYLSTMRTDRTWGGELEITALSELYQRRVEIYAQETTPSITFTQSVNYNNDLPPIRVSYKNGNDYNSVVAENHNDTTLNIHKAGEFEDAVLASLI